MGAHSMYPTSKNLRLGALASLSGVLIALCMPRPGLCFLAWAGLAPLILAVRRDGARPARGFALGWIAGFSYYAVVAHWIYATCRFAGTPAWVGVLAWAAMGGFLGVHWGLAAALGAFAAERLRPERRPWGWAIVWTAAFAAVSAWGPRLCGELLEYTQWRHVALIQVAAIFGPHGLGFLVALVNATLAEAWDAPLEDRARAPRLTAAAAAALLAVCWAFGKWQLAGRDSAAAASPAARVELLQPNVDQYEKWDAHSADRIMAGFEDLLALPASAAPSLIVWPESSIPRWVDEGKTIEEPARWSRRLDAFQMVGVVSKDDSASHNAAFLIGPDGSLRGGYFKRELVPFGEYVPLKFLKRYIGILDQMGDLTPGPARQALLETPLGLAGVTICYEAVFPRLSRLDAARGARLIVNITNDGWYRDTWGPYQHFYFNVFRAVENRVTILRSGNTGISAVIDPWGVITSRLELNRRGRLDADVPLDDPFPARSFYARHGDWFAALCGLAAAALFILACVG